MFDFNRDEIMFQPIEMLVPQRISPPASRSSQYVLRHAASRPMGAGRDLYGLKKDGSEFPIEIGLNPIETDEGAMVLPTIAGGDLAPAGPTGSSAARRWVQRHKPPTTDLPVFLPENALPRD